MCLDGFDEAIVGIGCRCGQPDVLVYSYEKLVETLVRDGVDYLDAQEYIDFNIVGAWVGPETPIILFPWPLIPFGTSTDS